ncbi:aminotransferase [Hypoxylon sp. NC1633]|nr:aminotransferase [Hypoxylon sp. NC1633]
MDNFQIFTSMRYDPLLLRAPSRGFTDIGWNQNPSPFYMLDLHRDRMLRAATHWNWKAAVAAISGEDGLERLHVFLRSVTSQLGDGPSRLMIILAQDGTLDHQISSLPGTYLNNLFPGYLPGPDPEKPVEVGERIPPMQDPIYQILLDGQKTSRSEFTHYKTTSRDMYNNARKRSQLSPGDMKEVLLINDEGHIMEGTISTPYFWREGKWVTPPVSKRFDSSHGSGGNDGVTRRWALERNLAVEQVVFADSLVDGEECWISNGLRGFIAGTVRLHEYTLSSTPQRSY